MQVLASMPVRSSQCPHSDCGPSALETRGRNAEDGSADMQEASALSLHDVGAAVPRRERRTPARYRSATEQVRCCTLCSARSIMGQ